VIVISAAPGRTKAEIAIDLPHPRSILVNPSASASRKSDAGRPL